MNNTLTADDPRYREMFDPAKEASGQGGIVLNDLTEALNELRERGPVLAFCSSPSRMRAALKTECNRVIVIMKERKRLWGRHGHDRRIFESR